MTPPNPQGSERRAYLLECLESAFMHLEILACEYLEQDFEALHRETSTIADAFLKRLSALKKQNKMIEETMAEYRAGKCLTTLHDDEPKEVMPDALGTNPVPSGHVTAESPIPSAQASEEDPLANATFPEGSAEEFWAAKAHKSSAYPDETQGSRVAAKTRAECNNLSPEERKRLFRLGMAKIYGSQASEASLDTIAELKRRRDALPPGPWFRHSIRTNEIWYWRDENTRYELHPTAAIECRALLDKAIAEAERESIAKMHWVNATGQTCIRLLDATSRAEKAERELKRFREEVEDAFKKHGLAAGPIAVDRLIEERDQSREQYNAADKARAEAQADCQKAIAQRDQSHEELRALRVKCGNLAKVLANEAETERQLMEIHDALADEARKGEV